jgi:tryptophan synthase alpha chain
MANISNYIDKINSKGEKALSVFLTSGFPQKENFVDLACSVFDAGADILEIGFPFSDPLADGPVIQNSSHLAIQNGINLKTTLEYAEKIKAKNDKPIILMGYANPILKYGIKKFAQDAISAGVDGIIIPDIPINEYEEFYDSSFDPLDIILLITPTTNGKRITEIDNISRGFVYCVSVSGTTGVRNFAQNANNDFLANAYSLIKKNKTMIGFGISTPEDVKKFSPYCDGVIVGSAVIKTLFEEQKNYANTLKLISSLKQACKSA